MSFIPVTAFGAQPNVDSTAAIRAAWASLRPGDILDVPEPGLWLVQSHAAGYPVLRADVDNVGIRLAPGAELALLPGGIPGPLVGSLGATGPRTGLTIYGGGALSSWSNVYPVVTWTSQQGRTLSGLVLRDIDLVGGEDGLYLGALSDGALLRNVSIRRPARYAIGIGKAAGGRLRIERSHLDRPSVASSVPHALHVESEGTPIRVEVTDHTTSDATLSLNGASGGWLVEDITLRDGVVMAAYAPNGILRRSAIRWRRPGNLASPRPVLLTGDCHGTLVEDVVIDNEVPDDPTWKKPALMASASSGVTLRRVRILQPTGTPAPNGLTASMILGPENAYCVGPGATIENVRVIPVSG